MTGAGLAPLEGHEEIRRSVVRSVARNELPGSLLLHGPAGVGKQRLGLWVGQLLLCERPGPEGPCERCVPCRLARRLEHPDLLWFFPLPRPRSASSPERLADALEEARAQELELWRAEPLRGPAPGEPRGIYLAQVQHLRRSAAVRPAMGPRKVFIVGNADALVSQESSPEAANALLKLLEEPPAGTFLLLTATDPDALLPTLRSRVLALRLRPLPEERVVAFLVRERATPEQDARRAARLGAGSIGAALGFLPEGGEPGPLERLREQGLELLQASLAADGTRRLAAAHQQRPAGARGEFADLLTALEPWLRDLAAVAAGSEDEVVNVDALPALRELAARAGDAQTGALAALGRVAEAAGLARGNVNPQLLTAQLLRSLGESLNGG